MISVVQVGGRVFSETRLIATGPPGSNNLDIF